MPTPAGVAGAASVEPAAGVPPSSMVVMTAADAAGRRPRPTSAAGAIPSARQSGPAGKTMRRPARAWASVQVPAWMLS